jgi:aconitase A
MGFFPIDDETLAYLRLTGRPREQVELAIAAFKKIGKQLKVIP